MVFSDIMYKVTDCYTVAIWGVYQFVGVSLGKKCNFPVEILEEHFDVPGQFRARAIAAVNTWYVPDWIGAHDLKEIQ
jgi:hypothetical protein